MGHLLLVFKQNAARRGRKPEAKRRFLVPLAGLVIGIIP